MSTKALAALCAFFVLSVGCHQMSSRAEKSLENNGDDVQEVLKPQLPPLPAIEYHRVIYNGKTTCYASVPKTESFPGLQNPINCSQIPVGLFVHNFVPQGYHPRTD